MPKQTEFPTYNPGNIEFRIPLPELSEDVLREAYKFFCNNYDKTIPANERDLLQRLVDCKRMSMVAHETVDRIVDDHVDHYQLLKQFFRLVFTSFFQDHIEISCNEKFIFTFNQDVEFLNMRRFSKIPIDKEGALWSEEKKEEIVHSLLNNSNNVEAVYSLLNYRQNRTKEMGSGFKKCLVSLGWGDYKRRKIKFDLDCLDYIPLDTTLYQAHKEAQVSTLDRTLHECCFRAILNTRLLLRDFIRSYVKGEYGNEEYKPSDSSYIAKEFDEILKGLHNIAGMFFLEICKEVRAGVNPTRKNGVFRYEYSNSFEEGNYFVCHYLTLGRDFDAKKADDSDMLKGNSAAQGQTEFNVLDSWSDALYNAFNHQIGLDFENKYFKDKTQQDKKKAVGNFLIYQFLRISRDNAFAKNTQYNRLQGYEVSIADRVDDVLIERGVKGDDLTAADAVDPKDTPVLPKDIDVHDVGVLSENAAKRLQILEDIREEQNDCGARDNNQFSGFTDRLFDEQGKDVSEYKKNNTRSDQAWVNPSTQLSTIWAKNAKNPDCQAMLNTFPE